MPRWNLRPYVEAVPDPTPPDRSAPRNRDAAGLHSRSSRPLAQEGLHVRRLVQAVRRRRDWLHPTMGLPPPRRWTRRTRPPQLTDMLGENNPPGLLSLDPPADVVEQGVATA